MWSSCCWYSIFLDAYTYSTRYLLISITIAIMAIFSVWIYEKPRIYKLIFKRSKHSNIVTPIESYEALETNLSNIQDNEVAITQEDEKLLEVESDLKCIDMNEVDVAMPDWKH